MILDLLRKLITKNGTRIPLFRVDFNFKKYKLGEPSCNASFHPNVILLPEEKKQLIDFHMKEIADIIRDNLDMEEMY